MSFVSTKLGQFRYFDEQLRHPDWRGKRVLDFGGNCGNLLKDQNGGLDEGAYWCIDVSCDAIARGRAAFSGAHWTFYDRYNFEFNPTGLRGLPIPDMGVRFDLILAYSVFTHTSRVETLDLVGQLRSFLAPGGTLAFTFLDPHWVAPADDAFPGSNLRWRLEARKRVSPALDVERLLQCGRGAEWLALVDDRLHVGDAEGEDHSRSGPRGYITFAAPEHMKAMFPDAVILPPVEPERHHCCVMRESAPTLWGDGERGA